MNQTWNFMKFEKKPIEITPTCAMCTRPIQDHSQEQMKFCTDERRKSHNVKITK